MASGFIDTNIVGTKMTDVDPCMFTVLYRWCNECVNVIKVTFKLSGYELWKGKG